MATRTPALQQRSNYHRNWGNYTDGGMTTPANGDLPNQASNPLANPEFSKLEAGDLAYVTTTDPGVYYCVSPGTVSGGDAVWAMLAAGGAVVQTIRDAHQIVVGQSAAPYSNVLGQDADVLDPGDGTGLETALANAAALVAGGFTGADVRVRPCAITLVPANLAAVPLVIPANVHLIGAGVDVSEITGGDGTGGTSQGIFSMLANTLLEGFDLISPAPAVTPGAQEAIVESLVGGSTIQDLEMTMQVGVTARVTGNCISVSGSNHEVRDCRFDVPDVLENSGIVGRAIRYGQTGSYVRATGGLCRNIVVNGGNQAIQVLNTDGIDMTNIRHLDAVTPPGCIAHQILVNPADNNEIPGIRLTGFFFTITDDDTAARQGIYLDQQSTNESLIGTLISQGAMRWFGSNPVTGRDGVLIAVADSGTVRSVLISNIHMDTDVPGQSLQYGFHADLTGGPSAVLQELRITNCYVDSPELDGVFLEGAGGGEGSASRTGITNCSLSGAGNAGVNIEANMTDTIVVANNFGASFTGIADAGTGTEAAHNI